MVASLFIILPQLLTPVYLQKVKITSAIIYKALISNTALYIHPYKTQNPMFALFILYFPLPWKYFLLNNQYYYDQI